MTGICISENPTTGVSAWWESDPDRPGFGFLTHKQDVAPILENNDSFRNETHGQRFGNKMRKVASIPPAFMGEIFKQGLLNDSRQMQKWLNERPYLKTFDKTFS